MVQVEPKEHCGSDGRLGGLHDRALAEPARTPLPIGEAP